MPTPLSTKRAHLQPPAGQPSIPDRLYFKIGDVARICQVEPHVLRFWETQFPQLKPNKSGSGQRLYRRRDVEIALAIKQLVHDEGFTLSGARQALQRAPRSSAPQPRLSPSPASETKPPESVIAAIGAVRAELREIASLLAAPASSPRRRRSRVASMAAYSDFLFPS